MAWQAYESTTNRTIFTKYDDELDPYLYASVKRDELFPPSSSVTADLTCIHLNARSIVKLGALACLHSYAVAKHISVVCVSET